MTTHYELVVIGSGPAGGKGAALAAGSGRSVALVERRERLGGAGLQTGSWPSKTLRETALALADLRQRGLSGLDFALRDGLTIADLMRRQTDHGETAERLAEAELARHRIDLYRGDGRLIDAHTVGVQPPTGDELRLTADVILLATGARPHHPEGVPFDGERVLDHETLLGLTRLPGSLIIVGGGVIGCEFASLFAALGVEVTLVDSQPQLLPFLDPECVERFVANLQRQGARLIQEQRVTRVQTSARSVFLTLSGGETLVGDAALYAIGRTANIEGLGLERVGVRLGRRGVIEVDANYRTNLPGIYAAGDVVGFPALASTAMEQARVAMVHAFSLGHKERLCPIVPLAVYTIPELAVVGLTEADCERQGIPYLVGRATYEQNTRGQLTGDTRGLLKLLFAPADGRLLGVHIIGELAAELIHLGAAELRHGATLDAFIELVFNYPTLSELYRSAAVDGLDTWQRWRTEQALEPKR